MSTRNSRRLVFVLAAGLAVLAVAAGLFVWMSWKRRAHERDRILVYVDTREPSSLAKNVEVATTLESPLANVPGVETMRAESTERDVTLTLTFPLARGPEEELARINAAKSALEPALKQLPPDVSAPVVDTLPGDLVTWWIAAERDIRDDLGSLQGVYRVEACGSTRERTIVTVDIARMQSLAVELGDVERAVDGAANSNLAAPPDVEAIANATLEHAGKPELRVRDVAVVSREPLRSCWSWLADAPSGTIHVVTLRRSAGRKAVETAALDKGALTIDDSDHAMVVRVMLPVGSTWEDHARTVSELVPSLRELRGLTFRGAILREGGDCDLLFARSPRTREDLAELRSLVEARPGLAWGGVRGGPPALRRLTVVVYGDDQGSLEPLAADVRERVGRVKGVGALVSRPIERVPRTVFEIDRAEAAKAGIDARDLSSYIAAARERLRLGSVDLRIRPSGAEAIGLLQVRGTPLSRVVRVTTRAEPHQVIRIDRRHAVELAWETDDDPALLARVRRALEGGPPTQASIDVP